MDFCGGGPSFINFFCLVDYLTKRAWCSGALNQFLALKFHQIIAPPMIMTNAIGAYCTDIHEKFSFPGTPAGVVGKQSTIEMKIISITATGAIHL
jgi:hypothetical protein